MSQQIEEVIIKNKSSIVCFGSVHSNNLFITNVDFDKDVNKTESKGKKMMVKEKKEVHEKDSYFLNEQQKVESEEQMFEDMHQSVVLQFSQGGLLSFENSQNKSQGLNHNLSGMNSINFSLTIEDHMGSSCLSIQEIQKVVKKSSLTECQDLFTRPSNIVEQNEMKNESLGSLILQTRKSTFFQQINIREIRIKSPNSQYKLNPFEEIVISPTYTLKNKRISNYKEQQCQKEQTNQFDEEKTNFQMRKVVLQPISTVCENNESLIMNSDQKTGNLEVKQVMNNPFREIQNMNLIKTDKKNLMKLDQELPIIRSSTFSDTLSNTVKNVFPNQHQWQSQDNQNWDHKFQQTFFNQQEFQSFERLDSTNKNEKSYNFEENSLTQSQFYKQRTSQVNRLCSISSLDLSASKMEVNTKNQLNETAQTLFPQKNELYPSGSSLPAKRIKINSQAFSKCLKVFPNLNQQPITLNKTQNVKSNQKYSQPLLVQDLSENIPDFDDLNCNFINNLQSQLLSKQLLFQKQYNSTLGVNNNKPNGKICYKTFNPIKLFPYSNNKNYGGNVCEINYENGMKNQKFSQNLYSSTTPRLNSSENKIKCFQSLETKIQENLSVQNLPVNKLEELRLKKKNKMMKSTIPKDVSLNFEMQEQQMKTPIKKGINKHMAEQTMKKMYKKESMSSQKYQNKLKIENKNPQSLAVIDFLTLY